VSAPSDVKARFFEVIFHSLALTTLMELLVMFSVCGAVDDSTLVRYFRSSGMERRLKAFSLI
jgi:hypothetical protein